MPKINYNGIARELTQAELEEYERMAAEFPAPEPTPEERIRDLEEALALILSGVTE